jgi:hypothetical protein
MAAMLVSAACGITFGGYRYATVWTPLQRAYLSQYVRASTMESLGITARSRFRLLYAVNAGDPRLALDQTRRDGRQLLWREVAYRPQLIRRFLGDWIYDHQTPTELLKPSLWCALLVLLAGLPLAIPGDARRLREGRQGRRLKGPRLVTARRFRRQTRADGIGFLQRERAWRGASWLRIPRAAESSHIMIMGDSGTGKSALIRQLLMQLEERGETAIVYDPALEYTPQFYRPERSDVILNPLDTRSPYWTPSDEWSQEAETLMLATSLFPDRFQENAFFTEAPRRIFGHLLTLKPTPQQLAAWLCQGDEMDRRLAGTPYAAMIDRQAPAQRSGVLASLNMVADTLKLLPEECDATSRWSASAWASQWPHGWLFLTSTPETRSRLVPLTSLWLDLLVLRLMNHGQPREHPAWFVLDELASLQRLPQLHTAITENRKSKNPVVLGFQGRSQLEARYGRDAEAMLSQPATKIFLRTSEPRAARWIAETIGEVETERLKESRSQGRGGHRQLGLERHVEPLVMASEISGLPSLRGFLKLGNLVVRLTTRFVHVSARAEALIERQNRIALPAVSEPPQTPGPSAQQRGGSRRAEQALRRPAANALDLLR